MSNGFKPHEPFPSSKFMNQSGGKEPYENFPITSTRSREFVGIGTAHSKSMVGYPYPRYPGSFHWEEFRSSYPLGGGYDGSSECRRPDNRRFLPPHEVYPDPYRYSGEHSDMPYTMRPGAVGRRNRIIRDEVGCIRPARSHEHMNLYPGRLPYRPGGEDDIQEHVGYQLSQPTEFVYSSGYGHAPYHPYDPRHGIDGPSGSFSQPVNVMYPMRPSERGGRPGRFRPMSELFDLPPDRLLYEEVDGEGEMEDRLQVKCFVSVPAVTVVLLRKMGGQGGGGYMYRTVPQICPPPLHF